MSREQRKLAAIVATDVVGYSRLMGRDESGTLARLRKNRGERLDPVLAKYHGRLVKLTGDGALIEFASAVDALSAAIEFQQAMADANRDQSADTALVFRIGLHLGDLIVEGEDLYGDGVNVAARLEGETPPGGVVISRAVRDAVVGRLNATFEDLGNLSLKNIERPVKAFLVKWRSEDWQPSASPDGASTGALQFVATSLPLPDKPSIAVLPFQNMSGDPEQEYFADGMVEDIITALSRFKSLFVIARNSSFTYKGKVVDIKQVGRELGVRYVLEGSVRRATGRVRITAQLIEAGTGAHLWAERFDGSLENVFDLQEEVATSIAGVIEPTLEAAETARSGARPTTDLTAYDLYLRAHAMVMSSARHMSGGLRLMEQAIARDPHYGPALAWAAFCCFRLVLDGQSDDATADRRKGIDFARRALEVANEDAGTLANAAFALAYFGEDIGAMIAMVDRALALNPSFARGWHISGVLRIWAGQLDLGVERVAASLRLSPRTRVADGAFVTGYARFAGHRFDEAVANLLLAIQQDPNFPHPYRVLAACYAHMGRLDDAHQTIARLSAIAPVMADDAHYLRNPEHRELLLSGLRLAMDETA